MLFLQLAHVARPRIGEQGVHRLLVDALDVAVAERVELVDEVPGQRFHVAFAVGQPRQVQRHHAHPVHQILAEAPGAHFLAQRAQRGRDQPHVNRDRVDTAQRHEGGIRCTNPVSRRPRRLYYFGARYYNPRTSVWQSADAVFDGSLHSPFGLAVFTYAHNNPLTLMDPTGLSASSGTWTAESAPNVWPAHAQENGEQAGLGLEIRGPGHQAAPFGWSAPPARGNVGLLGQKSFHITDTSETWKLLFQIAILPAPGPDEALISEKGAQELAEGGRLVRMWRWVKGLVSKEGADEAGQVAGELPGAANVAKHHIFPNQFRKFFESRGIDIDEYTVELSRTSHLKGVHGRGLGSMPGRWNPRWAKFIQEHPDATAKDIYQFGGKLLDEYGLSHLPIVHY